MFSEKYTNKNLMNPIMIDLMTLHGCLTYELLLLLSAWLLYPLSHMVLNVNCCYYCLAWLLLPCPTWRYM